MRFGLVHRVMTDALAALGILALVASGQFDRAVSLLVVACLVGVMLMKEGWRQQVAQRHVDTVAVCVLVAAQFGRAVLSSASVLDLLIEAAVGLQIIRMASRKGAAHDQQVIVLALLHLIAGTVVGGGLGYGLCFFGLLVVTPGALVLSHLRREVEGNYRQGARDRTGLPVDVPRILRSKRVVGRQFIAVTCLLSVPILLFTVVLFVVFPRVGLSLLLLSKGKGGRVIGFTDQVDLGQIGTLRSDSTVAARVFVPDLPPKPPSRLLMHLRGAALDQTDGRGWVKSNKQLRPAGAAGELVALAASPDVARDRRWVVELEPFDPPVLFLPEGATALRVEGGSSPGSGLSVVRGAEGELRYHTQAERGVRYEIYLAADDAPTFRQLAASDRPRYLELPDDLPARVRELAATWTSGAATDLERARLVESHLQGEYTYDLSSPSPREEQPLDHFLFESKRGHCEFYSTAMAILLRTQGVPTRNVTGFIGGTWNRFGGFYVVRQGDAHSWVEAFVDGTGWVTFDPTPPGDAQPQSAAEGFWASVRDFFEAVSQRWNQHVVGYDLSQQVGLFESLSTRGGVLGSLAGRLLVGAAVTLVAAAMVWVILRRRRRRQQRDGRGARIESKSAQLATSLYELLDRTLALIGLARGSTTPPLRHAEALATNGHPLAPEILDLTLRYLDARFGDQAFSPEDRRDFEARVKRLRERAKELERAAA
ncbi:MAG: DUF3488 domain-containing protein [Polyangiaceae bacterium]|nr:DUF3488 domain-containing protein [Polyangiaceae bacterium]